VLCLNRGEQERFALTHLRTLYRTEEQCTQNSLVGRNEQVSLKGRVSCGSPTGQMAAFCKQYGKGDGEWYIPERCPDEI
jgi:hypothetical protein